MCCSDEASSVLAVLAVLAVRAGERFWARGAGDFAAAFFGLAFAAFRVGGATRLGLALGATFLLGGAALVFEDFFFLAAIASQLISSRHTTIRQLAREHANGSDAGDVREACVPA
jgi:hypothetical protein